MEEHVLTADGITVKYFVIRRRSMKNLRMRVGDKGEIVVSCSPRTALWRIEAFVVKNIPWISKQQAKIKEEGTGEPRRYVNLEKYLFCGKEYTLVVLTGAKEKVNINGDFLVLTVKNEGDTEKKRRLLDNWYRRQAKAVFESRFRALAEKYREYFKDDYKLVVRQMKARWGTCIINKKTVVLNFKLIYADVKYLDYVIMHELCHFYHRNHDRAFYSMLGSFVPDCKQLKKQLTNFYIRYSHL